MDVAAVEYRVDFLYTEIGPVVEAFADGFLYDVPGTEPRIAFGVFLQEGRDGVAVCAELGVIGLEGIAAQDAVGALEQGT